MGGQATPEIKVGGPNPTLHSEWNCEVGYMCFFAFIFMVADIRSDTY